MNLPREQGLPLGRLVGLMSVRGAKRTCRFHTLMSAFVGKADVRRRYQRERWRKPDVEPENSI